MNCNLTAKLEAFFESAIVLCKFYINFFARVISRLPGGPGKEVISNPKDFKCRFI
jgi:hypothetical protein